MGFFFFFNLLFLFCFQIILYSGDKIYDNYYPDLKGRVHFTSNDVKSGDASINVTNLQLSDIGTYQCKVKKAPGVANRKFLLTVLGKLSFHIVHGGSLVTGKVATTYRSSAHGAQSWLHTEVLLIFLDSREQLVSLFSDGERMRTAYFVKVRK